MQACLVLLLVLTLGGLLNIQAKTVLQTQCEAVIAGGTRASYFWNRCLVWGSKDCNLLPNGHPAVVTSRTLLTKMSAMINTWPGVISGWGFNLGLRQANKTAEPTGHWEWNLPGRRSVPCLGDVWSPGEPNTPSYDCALYQHSTGTIIDKLCVSGGVYLCEYDDIRAPRSYVLSQENYGGHPAGRIFEGLETGPEAGQRSSCAVKCSNDPICLSFSFSQTTGHCILNQDDGTNPSYPPQPENGYDFYLWDLDYY